VNARLLADETVRGRLVQDCTAHARVVRDVIDAHLAGQLEDTIALRTCALELHSLKGAASILNLQAVITVIGGLCEPMLSRERPENVGFWDDFGRFFMELVGCVFACADSRAEQGMFDNAIALRGRVLSGLGAEHRGPRHTPVVIEGRALSPSAGRRILLVDDSATVRAALTARLTDRGYPVRAARSLTETARLLEEFDPEIVVTDVCMPNINGDELCRRIKAHMTRVVPVILYSNLADEELAQRAKAAGANGYVCKLSGIEALIDRMDELLGEEILF